MKEVIRNNKLLAFLFAIYLVAGFAILVYYSKGQFELLVNRHHHVYLDEFFLYITFLGDGLGSVIIIFLIFLRRIYYGLIALFSFLISTAIVQSMKRFIFEDFPRPKKFFQHFVDIRVIDGLELHESHSFPSGHSQGAFAVFIVLCLISKDKRWSILYFSLALMAAFSRVYLMQHFFIDTYFGAIIGTLTAVLAYYYMQYRSALNKKISLHRPLLRIFDKQ